MKALNFRGLFVLCVFSDLLARHSLSIRTNRDQTPFVDDYSSLGRGNNELQRSAYRVEGAPPGPLTEAEATLLTSALSVVGHYLGHGAVLLDGVTNQVASPSKELTA